MKKIESAYLDSKGLKMFKAEENDVFTCQDNTIQRIESKYPTAYINVLDERNKQTCQIKLTPGQVKILSNQDLKGKTFLAFKYLSSFGTECIGFKLHNGAAVTPNVGFTNSEQDIINTCLKNPDKFLIRFSDEVRGFYDFFAWIKEHGSPEQKNMNSDNLLKVYMHIKKECNNARP